MQSHVPTEGRLANGTSAALLYDMVTHEEFHTARGYTVEQNSLHCGYFKKTNFEGSTITSVLEKVHFVHQKCH